MRRAPTAGYWKADRAPDTKAGALDALGERGDLLANIERLLSLATAEQKLRSSGQSTMFDLFGQSTPVPMPGLELIRGMFRPKKSCLGKGVDGGLSV